MSIPYYETLLLPLLTFHADKEEHSRRESIDHVANDLGLTDQERRELLPSGQQPTFDNRMGWATTYLAKAGLLERTRRANFKITERGLKLLNTKPSHIDVNVLKQYPEFQEWP